MMPSKNMPLLLRLGYIGYNRGLIAGTDLAPVLDADGNAVKTFCNLFIQYILNGFGYMDMNGMTANEMVKFMSDPINGWISPSSEDVVQSHANDGVIVIAGRSNPGSHGHVCLILPGILENSGDWGKSVPCVVNVGKDIFYGKKISWAFRSDERPSYFAMSNQIV